MTVKKTPINAYGFIIWDTSQEQATHRDVNDRKGWSFRALFGYTVVKRNGGPLPATWLLAAWLAYARNNHTEICINKIVAWPIISSPLLALTY